jgi:hypothetical protein
MRMSARNTKYIVRLVALVAISLSFGAASASATSTPPDWTPDSTCGVTCDDSGGACYTSSDCGYGEGETGVTVEQYSAYSPDSADASAGRCRTRWAVARRKNVAGIRVFTYYEQVRWCWNGLFSKVTLFHRDRWTGSTNLGWSFDGHVSTNCGAEDCHGMTGSTVEEAWTQGHYHVGFTVLGIGYVVNKYPVVDITVHSDGTSSARWCCS